MVVGLALRMAFEPAGVSSELRSLAMTTIRGLVEPAA
jgi:hypothetical protein